MRPFPCSLLYSSLCSDFSAEVSHCIYSVRLTRLSTPLSSHPFTALFHLISSAQPFSSNPQSGPQPPCPSPTLLALPPGPAPHPQTPQKNRNRPSKPWKNSGTALSPKLLAKYLTSSPAASTPTSYLPPKRPAPRLFATRQRATRRRQNSVGSR